MMVRIPKRHRLTPKRTGPRIPDRILALLKSKHPTVRIFWERATDTYCLVQIGTGGQVRLISKLRGVPTLDNTVAYLDSISWTQLCNRHRIKAFLDDLDRTMEPSDPPDFDDRMADIADRMRHAAGIKRTI